MPGAAVPGPGRLLLRRLGVPVPTGSGRWSLCRPCNRGRLTPAGVAATRSLSAAAPVQPPPAPSLEGLSYLHTPGEPLLYLSLGHLAARAAQRYGEQDAVVSVDEGVRLTYRQLLQLADSMAGGLRRLGLQPGERVAIWGPNSWRWIVTKIALARAGLVSVDMNPVYASGEALHCLALARVAAVVVAEEHRGVRYHDLLSAMVPELPRSSPERIKSAVLPDLRNVISWASAAPPGCVTFDQVLSSASPEDVTAVEALQADVCPDAASNIQFSSGTTGKPKAIVLSHLGLVNNGFYNGKRFGFHEKRHVVCLQTPLFHVYGTIVIMSSVVNYGGTIVLPCAGYDPKRGAAATLSERCTVMTGTPTMHVDMVRTVEAQGVRLDSLELAVTGGAPITPEFVRKMKSVLGVKRICSVYGLSETSAVVFQGTRDDTEAQMAETVGRLGENIEAKVVDPHGRLVPFGQPGELLVRGYCNMKGYFQNEEATAKTLVDGWIRTGDKFVLHESGYGRIVGRLKDMVIRGGENIYPKEVEDAIGTCGDIEEVEVVGVSDQRMGEELCACLKVRAGATVTADDLRAFLKGKVAPFKIPRYCVTMPDFPKTLSGKIQKYKLREACERLLGEGKLDEVSRKGSGQAAADSHGR